MRDSHTPRRRLTVGWLGDPARCAPLKAALADRGVDLCPPTADRAEVVVFDATASSPQLAAQARAMAGDRPLICLTHPHTENWTDDYTASGADLLVPNTRSARPLVSVLRQAAGDSELAQEAALRIASLGGLGHPPGPGDPSLSPPAGVICFGQPAPRTLALHADGAAHTDLSFTLSRAHALSCLESGAAGGVMIVGERPRRQAAGLVRLLQRHGDLSTIPIIAIEPTLCPRSVLYWTETGANGVFADRDLPTALASLKALMRRRAARLAWGDILSRTRLNSGGAISPLVSPALFEAMLAARLRTRQPFALGAVRLVPESAGDTLTAMAEAAVYLGIGSQPIDMISRPSPDVFLITMPYADERRARMAMTAIARMVEDLKFGPRDASVTFSARWELVKNTDAFLHRPLADLLRTAVEMVPCTQAPTAALA